MAASAETTSYDIPKTIHIIWLGIVEINEKQSQRIIDISEVNSDYATTIWTLKDYSSWKEKTEASVFEALAGQNIELKDIEEHSNLHVQELLTQMMSYPSSVLMDSLKANFFAAASDILRWLVLFDGGIYLDDDNEVVEPFGDIHIPMGLAIDTGYKESLGFNSFIVAAGLNAPHFCNFAFDVFEKIETKYTALLSKIFDADETSKCFLTNEKIKSATLGATGRAHMIHSKEMDEVFALVKDKIKFYSYERYARKSCVGRTVYCAIDTYGDSWEQHQDALKDFRAYMERYNEVEKDQSPFEAKKDLITFIQELGVKLRAS